MVSRVSLVSAKSQESTYGGRLRQHLIGVVDPLEGKVHVAFSDTFKAQQFQNFLEGPLARYKDAGKILLVLDNARAHDSKELEPFLEANKEKLELLFLPPYSPDLNPME